MAIRLVVEYPNLQVSVKTQEVSLTVEAAESNSPTLQTSTLDPNLGVSASVIAPISGALLDFVQPNLAVQSLNLFADILVDPDTKNLYFTKGNPNAVIVSMLEELAYSVNKPFTDSFSFTDDQTLDVGKGLADSATMLESIDILLEFLRDFSDSYTLSDQPAILFERPITDDNFNFSDDQTFDVSKRIQHSVLIFEDADFAIGKNVSDSFSISEDSIFNLGLGKSDSVSMGETDTKDLSLSKSDTLSMSEAPALLFEAPHSDSFTMSESFSRTVDFVRSFSDAFSLDDVASVDDPLQTDVSSEKTNVAFLSEDSVFDFTKPLSDTATMSEQAASLVAKPFSDSFGISEQLAKSQALAKADSLSISEEDVISFSKSIDDTLTMSESISLKVIISSKSVLNTAALNTSALN